MIFSSVFFVWGQKNNSLLINPDLMFRYVDIVKVNNRQTNLEQQKGATIFSSIFAFFCWLYKVAKLTLQLCMPDLHGCRLTKVWIWGQSMRVVFLAEYLLKIVDALLGLHFFKNSQCFIAISKNININFCCFLYFKWLCWWLCWW